MSAGTAAVAMLIDNTLEGCGLSLDGPPTIIPGAPPGSCENPIYSEPFTMPASTHTLGFLGIDNVLNAGVQQSTSVVGDYTPPSVTLQDVPEYTNNPRPSFNASFADTLAGLDVGRLSISLNGSPLPLTVVVDSSLTWRTSSPLLRAVSGNSLVYNNGTLYSLGGNAGDYIADVSYSRLGAGGVPGDWHLTTQLPGGSGFLGAAALNDTLYAVGNWPGSSRFVYINTTPDGPLAADHWTPGPDLPVSLFNAPAVAITSGGNGWLYAIGGQLLGNTPQTIVRRIKLAPGGVEGIWGTATALPETITSHAATSLGGRIYVVGGLTDAQSQTTKKVWSAQVLNAAGDLSTWQQEPDLPIGINGVRGTAALAAGGRLYVVGGYDDRTLQFKRDVYSAKPVVDGSTVRLDGWRRETDLLEPLGFHGGAASPNGLYLAGGGNGAGTIATVRFLILGAPTGIVDTAQAVATSTSALAENTYTVEAAGDDRVANHGSRSQSLVVDMTAPEIVLRINGRAVSSGSVTMVTQIPELAADYSDALSGIEPSSVKFLLNGAAVGSPYIPASLAPGTHQLSAFAADRAGNSRTVTASFLYDPDPPSVVVTAPAPNSLHGDGPVSLAASFDDVGSGLSTASIRLSVDGLAAAATVSEPAPSVSTLSWLTGSPLLRAVSGNSLVYNNGTLYSLGGNAGNYVDEVSYSRLGSDGAPGDWKATTVLPGGSGFLGAAALNDTLYAVGNWPGSSRFVYINTTPEGPLAADHWTQGPDLPVSLFNAPAVAITSGGNGWLYAIGGQLLGNTPQTTVRRIKLAPGGIEGIWGTATALPETITSHAAATLGGRIYVVGGLTDAQSQTTKKVWSAKVLNADGDLSTWQQEADLPIGVNGVRGTVALAAGGRLYVAGGYDDRTLQFKRDVYSAKPVVDGATMRLDGWRRETDLPEALGFHGGAAGPAGLYLAGGGNGAGTVATVRYALLPRAGGVVLATAAAAGLGDGLHVFLATAADFAGNVAFASSTFYVDVSSPMTSLVVHADSVTAPGVIIAPSSATFSLLPADRPLPVNAGVAQTYLSVNGVPEPDALATLSRPDGSYVLEFWSVDNLGHAESTRTVVLTLQAPAASVDVADDGTAGISAPQEVAIATVAPQNAPAIYQLALGSQNYVSVFPSFYLLTSGLVFPPDDPAVISFYLDLTVVTDTTTLAIYTFDEASKTWLSTSIVHQEFTKLSDDFGIITGEIFHTSAYALLRRLAPSDARPPSVAFSYPHPDEPGLCRLAQGPLAVRGSAADENLTSWRLTQGAALLGAGTADVDGALGTWDATGLSGAFTLSLSAADAAGNTASAGVPVQAGLPARTLALGGKQALNKPRGVATGPNRIYVSDTNADAVRVFDAAGTPLAVLGDKKGAAKLNKPSGLVLDGSGNILVADANNKRVVKLSPAGVFLAEYGKGLLQRPMAVALSAGKIVVADAKAGQLVVFSDAGALLTRVDLPPATGPDEDPEEPRPVALAADSAGNIWAADSKRGRVLRYDSSFALAQTIPGFARPEGVAVSASGACLAVSDSKTSRIRTFDAQLAAGLAAFGAHGEVKENKPLPAEFFLNKPAQLAFDAAGTLLVADRNNDLVQGFGLPGAPLVVALGTPRRSGGGTRLASADGESAGVAAVARVGRLEGGRVENPDGAAVEVPAGAISEDLDVGVAKAADSGDEHRAREAARTLVGLAAASPAREFSPHGLTFAEPAVITLPYDALLAAAPRELKIHYWNAERGVWEALPSEVDEGARTVSARVSHFSIYQVLGQAGAVNTLADPEAGFAFRAIYAFPNPAVGGQKPTVHVAVGRADKVTIRFYDIAGTPVHETTLDAPSVVNDESGPHLAYEYAWDGHIPSGIYLYAVTAEKAGYAPIKRIGKLAVVR